MTRKHEKYVAVQITVEAGRRSFRGCASGTISKLSRSYFGKFLWGRKEIVNTIYFAKNYYLFFFLLRINHMLYIIANT